MKKALVVINEQHKLFPDQEALLRERFDTFDFFTVPADGWTLEKMQRVAEDLHYALSRAEVRRHPETGKIVSVSYPGRTENAVVFASPVPFLLKELAKRSMFAEHHGDHAEESELYSVLVFHNDRREKKELSDGRIIQTVAATGWRLV